MNKKCFRVIFSKTLQRLVVTSELAKSEGKSTEPCAFGLSHIFAQIRPLTFSLYCALGFVAFSNSALANLIIQADKSAPKNQQPIVLQTANGLPQVNIQTPNDKGLSHNKYAKFDVDTKGAILNNSRTNVQTQQGGLITGNPYLARGEAKVILNEVNSSDPSVLKGYVEVAGKKADVIIANPSGIHCEGCGIINSNRATFTTGKPQIKNGNLESFVVEKGKVKVSGKGLDNSRVDYTEIIARETQVNAGVWSKKEAKVITGKNTVKRLETSADLQIIHNNQPLADEPRPQVAVDVGELGGMYSGKIHLIGTEKGVGVHNAGHIGASAETLKIDSKGRIVNTGTLNANHAVQLAGTKGIENRGKIENRQGDMTFNTAADIQQDGSVVARGGHIHQTANQAIHQQGETVAKGHITYKAPSVTASTSSLIASGVEVKDSEQGEVRTLGNQSAQGKSITVITTGKTSLQGKNVASGNINVSSSEADLDNSHTSAHAVNINASQGKIQANNAILIANAELALITPTSLETQHSDVKAEKITTKQRSLNTKGATWEQTGTGELKLDVADTLHNSGGTFKTQGDLTVNAQGVNNQQGRLIAKDKLTINTERGKLDSTQGLLVAEQDIAINSGELINDGGLIQSNQNVAINTQGQSLSNKQTLTDAQDKGIVALGEVNIQAGNVVNRQGRIVSVGKQIINVANVDNQQGLVYTQDNSTLNAKNLSNDEGSIRAVKQADITLSDNLNQQNGAIKAQTLNLTANALNSLTKSVISADDLNIITSNELSNKDSHIIAKLNGDIQTGSTLNNKNGTIGSQERSFIINTHQHRLENEQGNIIAAQNIDINSGEINNNQGLISANEIAINSNNQSINNQKTVLKKQGSKGIIAQHSLTLHSNSLNNNNGNILSRNNATVNTASLINHQGEIRTQSQLDLHTNTLEQNNGLITANTVNLVADAIKSNKQSEISGNQVNVTAQTLDNQESKLIARQLADVDVKQGIQNQNGILASLGEKLTINSNQSDINNTGGMVLAQNGTLKLNTNMLNNKQGSIRAKIAEIFAQKTLDNRNTLADSQQGIIATDLSLKAKQLDNQAGRITALNSTALQASDIQNQSGEILMVNDGSLNADKINNQAGQIASLSANLNITTQTALNNQQGTIKAENMLTLMTKGLENQQGKVVSSNQLLLKTDQQQIDNQQGTLFAKNKADIHSGNINNLNGLIRADDSLLIEAYQNVIDNRYTQDALKGIVGLRSMVLQGVTTLFNQQGKLYGGNTLNITTAEDIQNQQGIFQSQGDLTLSTQSVNNQEGKISSHVANITAKTINNRATSEQGSLIYADKLTLNTEQLDNQGTKAKDKSPAQGIQGQDIVIQTATLNNQQGGIYSANNVSITSNNHLDNSEGELLAVNTVDVLNGNNLMVNNEKGLIQGNKTVTLNATGLASEGNIKTKGDLNIALKESFILNNAFEANNLTFKTEGNFTNNTEQRVANKMTISANHIENRANAELSSNETMLNSTNLINRGLIDGVNTVIKSSAVTNIGTGRIYGDHLAINAATVENLAETVNGETKAATIAARERLDFGVNTLINQDGALILSLGNTVIGNTLDKNNHAVGKANLIQNDSATIELLGNAVVNAQNVINRDTKIKTRIREEKETFDLYGKENATTEKVSEWYRVGVDGEMDHANGKRKKSATFTFYDRAKGSISSHKGDYWQRREFTQTRYIPEIYDESPAKFLVGGNLHLNSENTLNQYSQLLIGERLYFNEQNISQSDKNIDSNNGKLVNEDFTAIQSVDEQGYFYRYQQKRLRSGKGRRHKNFLKINIQNAINEQSSKELHFNLVLNTIGTPITSSATVDDKTNVKDIQLDTVSVMSNSAESPNGISIERSPLNPSIGKHTEMTLTPTINNHNVISSGQVIAKLQTAVEKVDPQDLSSMTMPMVKTHLTEVRLPQSSLYKINPDAPNGYLVETDPKFTDRKRWLSSDYMFEQLRYNHDNVHKRLGDGFYEQRLINEQINQLTGRRYIEGYNNDFAQYQALMKSGVEYAKQFNLALGVGLTAKQMSELTTDMVWLVNKEVTLADGRKITALVPQVYLVARDSDISSRGAVISANQIEGNVGELNNSGVIAGRDLIQIHSSQLQNEGSILGDTVDLSAQQNLINLGGRIEAVKSLSLSAGKNLDISSTLSSSESADGNVARTVLDRLASVKVTGAGGHLALHSNENLTIKAADIESQGSLSATAGNMLNVTTLAVRNKEYYNGDADNYYRLAQHSEVGSSLKGKDDVTLVAKKDVRLRQSNIGSEKGNVLISSKQGNIQVEAGREEEQLASASKSVSRGRFGLSKTTEIRRHEHHIEQSVGSNIDGKTVNLIAGQGNVTVQGSNVVGENGLTVRAKNIDIKEAENKVYSEDFHSKKKSGVLGGGGLGVTFGAQKQTLESDKTKFYAQGSQVGSLNGNVTLIAENHYTQTASLVSAIKGGDVNILAKKVDIKAADDKYETNTKQTFEQKGVTLAVTSPILSALQAVQGTVKSVERVGQSKNDRVNAMAAANSAMDAYRAGQAVGQAGKAMQEAMENGNMDSVVGAQITYGQQKSESRTHTEGKTAAKSQVNAGGKVNIVATGAGKASNITIQGSDVSGKQGTFLEADNDINITAAEQTHKERSTNKSSGFNAGLAIKVSNGAAVGATLGGNHGKGYGNGDETTYVASHVGDSQSKTVIQAGGDANIIGSQVKGKRVEVNAQNLNIESLQDTATYKGKQMNASGSMTVGYGVSAGGSYNKSKVNADHASVNEQAGIYAGDEGYDINVNHTDLKGGLITSTQKAEDEGKNRFSTGTITHSDIENYSNHNAKGFGVGGGVTIGGGNAPKEIGGVELQKIGQNNADGSGKVETGGIAGIGSQGNWGLAKGLITGLLGQVSDKGSEHGVTTSSINTKNLIIRDKEAQEQLTRKSINETIETLNQENRHQKLAKADIESIKSDLERDLSVATKFVENVNSVGDDIYYN
ncbi:two-partner secretion domain-containing protein, partial [Haemophilus parainfluenzae]